MRRYHGNGKFIFTWHSVEKCKTHCHAIFFSSNHFWGKFFCEKIAFTENSVKLNRVIEAGSEAIFLSRFLRKNFVKSAQVCFTREFSVPNWIGQSCTWQLTMKQSFFHEVYIPIRVPLIFPQTTLIFQKYFHCADSWELFPTWTVLS